MNTKSLENLSTLGTELTKAEMAAIVGGSDTWTIKYADGRTVVYYNNLSITYYPDGSTRTIVYGAAVFQ